MNRRKFLRWLGLAPAAAVTVAVLGPGTASEWPYPRDDMEKFREYCEADVFVWPGDHGEVVYKMGGHADDDYPWSRGEGARITGIAERGFEPGDLIRITL